MPDFGKPGDADRLLSEMRAKGAQLQGQTRSTETEAKLEANRAKLGDDQLEAAGYAEEIVKGLNETWNEREYTVEQRVFSLALAMTNFREGFPETLGGKPKFDEIAHKAWQYYQSAK